MARNRYSGTCYCCGVHTPVGYGHFERHGNSWRIKCVKCASGRVVKDTDKESLKDAKKNFDAKRQAILLKELENVETELNAKWFSRSAEERERMIELLQAEKDGKVFVLPFHVESSIGTRITERREGIYNYYSIHRTCYIGDDCRMPHCNGCQIRTMYQITQMIEDQQESLKERDSK